MNIRVVNSTNYNVPVRGLGMVLAGRSRTFLNVTTAMLESGGVAADLERLRLLGRLTYTILRGDAGPDAMERPTVEDLAGGRIVYRTVTVTNEDCTEEATTQSFSMGDDLPAGAVPFYVSLRLITAGDSADCDSITAHIEVGEDVTSNLNIDGNDGASNGDSLVEALPHQAAVASVNLVVDTTGADVDTITALSVSATMMVFVPTVD